MIRTQPSQCQIGIVETFAQCVYSLLLNSLQEMTIRPSGRRPVEQAARITNRDQSAAEFPIARRNDAGLDTE